jgi:hypothetical protein
MIGLIEITGEEGCPGYRRWLSGSLAKLGSLLNSVEQQLLDL